MLLAIGCVLLGAALALLVQYDIIATVFHPQLESSLSNRFHRATWRLFRLGERLMPDRTRCHGWLSWGMPLMVAGLIGLWLLLSLLGFALIYYPWIADPAHFGEDAASGSASINALYFSGVMLTTVGLSDLQPTSGPFRLLAVLESAAGFVAVSLSVAYLLSVYPALSSKRAAAIALDAEVAGEAGALPMVRRYLGQNHGEWSADLSERLRELSQQLLTITEAHETHPVLYYAHARRVQHSFLRILVTVQSLVGLLRYGLSPDRHRDIVYNPQLLLLEQSLHYSLRRLSASLHIIDIEEPDERGNARRIADDYARLCGELERIGLLSARSLAREPVPALIDTDGGGHDGPDALPQGATRPASRDLHGLSDPALDWSARSPLDAYQAFREETDPHLDAYAVTCGYRIEDARRAYETTWWAGGR